MACSCDTNLGTCARPSRKNKKGGKGYFITAKSDFLMQAKFDIN